MERMSRYGMKSSLGQYLGYLPQDIELFADTVAANISRFQEGEDQETILAAQMAGVHEMILRLPDGYDTQVGEGGAISLRRLSPAGLVWRGRSTEIPAWSCSMNRARTWIPKVMLRWPIASCSSRSAERQSSSSPIDRVPLAWSTKFWS